ncbi:Ubiquitin carboxyl-terminal hydrolase 30 [Choanephora cucurbitarum]|uniref:ubiquitinyl hydrolase 1 n=1 Tax=Choanephora cucurbitarum TaxID=101091 RepID=A0A1C7NIR4_9FUNG|nr:Ubiquitin carboxyl-terminal hydrolase 30 [Choanephora cucurbitarum]
MSSSNYHLPTIAAVAGFALAASSYVLTGGNSFESKKRRRRIRSKIQRERDGQYILGLVNTQNYCFVNSVLQAFATLSSLRSYLAERVDEQGDESAPAMPQNEFILESVACALYATIEMLNRPLPRPKAITPTDFLNALEKKSGGTINRDQQDAHELFQIISSVLTAEEEVQYKENATSLFDATTLRGFAIGDNDPNSDNFETSSVSSFGTTASMWSSFSVCTVGGHLRPRRKSPRNPFTGLAASKISCINCGYTAPIRHHTFDNISLNVPQTSSCTLESCLKTYTKVDILNDYQCRKCTLVATLESLTKELEGLGEDDEEKMTKLNIDIGRIKDALRSNVEATLYGLTLSPPKTAPRTTKQTMFANPPKSLCLHLSRSIYHPSGIVQKNHCQVEFSEYLDLAPYTTNGYLNTSEPTASLSSPPPTPVLPHTRTSRTSLVYLRNMTGGHRFTHSHQDGLGVALLGNPKESDRVVQNALPSLSVVPVSRAIQYKLCAAIVHYGSHDSGHFVTYRRKKLPTGHEVRSPLNEAKPKPPTKFWRCSDEIIEEVDLETVLKSEAYMLFYERE